MVQQRLIIGTADPGTCIELFLDWQDHRSLMQGQSETVAVLWIVPVGLYLIVQVLFMSLSSISPVCSAYGGI